MARPNRPEEPNDSRPSDKERERMESALQAAMGDKMPQSAEELQELIQKAVRSYVNDMVQQSTQSKNIAQSIDVVFDGRERIIGLDKIKNLRHELITGIVPDPDFPKDRNRAAKRHNGIFNMPWVMVTLPWTAEDERNWKASRPTPYPKEYFPQVAGLSWRVVAGRPQKIPLIYAEVLANAGVIAPEALPDGNGVRSYLERVRAEEAEAEARKEKRWQEIGMMVPGDLSAQFLAGLGEIRPVSG